jgi:NADH-quinone oxidoreductase subunit E
MSFTFSAELEPKIGALLLRYPTRRAALLPVLRLIQDEHGHISADAERRVAEILDLTPINVREVVTFYTMLTRSPVGRFHLQVCSNVSCGLAGGDRVSAYLQAKLGVRPGETTPDGKYTLTEVECLGACDEAPCMMVNFDFYGHLEAARVDEILDGLA